MEAVIHPCDLKKQADWKILKVVIADDLLLRSAAQVGVAASHGSKIIDRLLFFEEKKKG